VEAETRSLARNCVQTGAARISDATMGRMGKGGEIMENSDGIRSP